MPTKIRTIRVNMDFDDKLNELKELNPSLTVAELFDEMIDTYYVVSVLKQLPHAYQNLTQLDRQATLSAYHRSMLELHNAMLSTLLDKLDNIAKEQNNEISYCRKTSVG